MLEENSISNENGKCNVCKKKYYVAAYEWIFILQHNEEQEYVQDIFCVDCWLSIGGEEYVFALPERLKKTGDDYIK